MWIDAFSFRSHFKLNASLSKYHLISQNLTILYSHNYLYRDGDADYVRRTYNGLRFSDYCFAKAFIAKQFVAHS